MNLSKYTKTDKTQKRRTKVSSVNIEYYQHALLEEKNLNLSSLVRDYLDALLAKEYPERFKELKEADLVQVLQLLKENKE